MWCFYWYWWTLITAYFVFSIGTKEKRKQSMMCASCIGHPTFSAQHWMLKVTFCLLFIHAIRIFHISIKCITQLHYLSACWTVLCTRYSIFMQSTKRNIFVFCSRAQCLSLKYCVSVFVLWMSFSVCHWEDFRIEITIYHY